MRESSKRCCQVALQLSMLLSAPAAIADSSCTATNDNGDQTCSVSCPTGQTAACQNATGSAAPSCSCTGAPTPSPSATRHVLASAGTKGNWTLRALTAAEITQPPAPITNTNLVSVINAKLATLPDQHISNSCQDVHGTCYRPTICQIHGGHEVCTGGSAYDCVKGQACSAVNGKLTVGTPLLVSKGPTVSLGQPDLHSIPTSVFTRSGVYTNCSSVQQSETFTHLEQISEGDTVTKTNTLQTGSVQTTTINGSVGLGPLTLGGSRSLQINTTTTYSEADAENHTQMESEQQQLPLLVPSMTQSTITHSFILYNVPVPFTGTVLVDGQLSSNLANLNTLSQVLPTESDRTFTFVGIVTNSTLIDTSVLTNEKKLTAADCQANPGLTIRFEGGH
jgi:hypothetical protein